MSQPPSPQIPGSAPKKKGLPTLAWVGIGCGGIVIICIIAAVLAGGFLFKVAKSALANPGKSSAEFVVAGNKDLTKVSENDDNGEMTVRVKSTGEQLTLKYDDLAKGRILVKDKDGNVAPLSQGDLAKVPAWVPRYPGITDEVSLSQSEDASSGMLAFTTNDSAEAIKKFYSDEADKISLNSSTSTSVNLGDANKLNLTFGSGPRALKVDAFNKSGEPLSVKVLYSGK